MPILRRRSLLPLSLLSDLNRAPAPILSLSTVLPPPHIRDAATNNHQHHRQAASLRSAAPTGPITHRTRPRSRRHVFHTSRRNGRKQHKHSSGLLELSGSWRRWGGGGGGWSFSSRQLAIAVAVFARFRTDPTPPPFTAVVLICGRRTVGSRYFESRLCYCTAAIPLPPVCYDYGGTGTDFRETCRLIAGPAYIDTS